MKALVVFILCVSSVRVKTEEICPDNVVCSTSETIDSCSSTASFVANVTVHGCCPGCVEGLKDKGDPCNTKADCKPGLDCNKICAEDTTQPCALVNLTPNPYFTPTCSPDGTYAPKQCKGAKKSGMCFCVDKEGKRIFGEEKWEKADNMTCACSRKVAEIKETRPDVSIHCNDLGNFEPLQCDQGVCWCADEYSGDATSIVVPEKLMEILPCYFANKVGNQYLRQCDSQFINQETLRKLIYNHGSTDFTFGQVNCNFDGSFARYQIIDNKKKCTYKDKTVLTDGIGLDDNKFKSVNCNCAYDKQVALYSNTPFDKDCESYGNYKKVQVSNNGKFYCVDADGFAASGLFDDPTTPPGTCPTF